MILRNMFVHDKQETSAGIKITKKKPEFDKFKFIQQLQNRK